MSMNAHSAIYVLTILLHNDIIFLVANQSKWLAMLISSNKIFQIILIIYSELYKPLSKKICDLKCWHCDLWSIFSP